MLKIPIVPGALAALILSLASGMGQEEILIQDFDLMPVEYEGRFGVTTPTGDYDSAGRWGNFGNNGTNPHLQEDNSDGGVAVELYRGAGDGTQVLLASFPPIQVAQKIMVNFSLMVSEQGGASVSLSRINDPAMGVLLQTIEPEIRGWNGEIGKWEELRGLFPTGEWVQVQMVCDVEEDSYEISVKGANGRQISQQSLPFDKSLLGDQGLGTLIVSPQFEGPIYFDNVDIRIDP